MSDTLRPLKKTTDTYEVDAARQLYTILQKPTSENFLFLLYVTASSG